MVVIKKHAIVYIITKLELGGAQKVCLELFEAFNNEQSDAFLISGAQGYFVEDVSRNKNVFLLDSMQREIGFLSIIKEIKNFLIITRILYRLKKQYNTLIVHTHSTKAGMIGRWAAWLSGIKVRIHTVHGFSFHKHQFFLLYWFQVGLEMISSMMTSRYVYVSTQDAQQAQRLFPAFNKKNSIIRPCVQAQFFEHAISNSEQKDAFIIGTIACFKPQKNIFDLLAAFERALIINASLRLEIIGDGIQRESIVEWIHKKQLESHITLHGWQADVLPFMQRWHAFALSSLWEGMPCAVVEARLLKLPVVAYDTGDIKEVIHNGKNGFIIPQLKWILLSDALIELSLSKSLYQSMRNYQDTLEEFSVPHLIEAHRTLYQPYWST